MVLKKRGVGRESVTRGATAHGGRRVGRRRGSAEGSTRGSRWGGNHCAARGNRVGSSWRDRIVVRRGSAKPGWCGAPPLCSAGVWCRCGTRPVVSFPPSPAVARFCCKSTPFGCCDRTTARCSTVAQNVLLSRCRWWCMRRALSLTGAVRTGRWTCRNGLGRLSN